MGATNPGTVVLNCDQSNSHGIKLASRTLTVNLTTLFVDKEGNVTADRFLKVESVSRSGATGVGQLSFAEVSGGTSCKQLKQL